MTGQVWESQKKISIKIIATTTTHLPKQVFSDLTAKSGSVSTNPIRKGGVQGASWCNIIWFLIWIVQGENLRHETDLEIKKDL